MKHRLFLLATATLALALFNSCGKDEEPCPTASFTVSTSGIWDVTLTDNSTNASSYSINWGDGNTSDYWYAYHDYATSGTYTITLKVKNSDGSCSDVATRSVVVSHSSPSPTPTPTPSNPTQVKINSLMLNRFPAYPSSGDWDPLDNKPEVYFTITDGNGTQVFYTSAIKTGGISNDDCPTTFGSVNYTIYNLTATYRFNFYDHDDYDSDDLMAVCSWTPSLQNNSHASSYLWSNTSISFTLNLTWYSSKGEALYTKDATFVDGQLVSDDPELQALFGASN